MSVYRVACLGHGLEIVAPIPGKEAEMYPNTYKITEIARTHLPHGGFASVVFSVGAAIYGERAFQVAGRMTSSDDPFAEDFDTAREALRRFAGVISLAMGVPNDKFSLIALQPDTGVEQKGQ